MCPSFLERSRLGLLFVSLFTFSLRSRPCSVSLSNVSVSSWMYRSFSAINGPRVSLIAEETSLCFVFSWFTLTRSFFQSHHFQREAKSSIQEILQHVLLCPSKDYFANRQANKLTKRLSIQEGIEIPLHSTAACGTNWVSPRGTGKHSSHKAEFQH